MRYQYIKEHYISYLSKNIHYLLLSELHSLGAHNDTVHQRRNNLSFVCADSCSIPTSTAWQDDKASVLLMDRADVVVVMKGLDFSCQPTVSAILRSLFHKWNALRGITIITSALQKSTPFSFYMTKPTNSM